MTIVVTGAAAERQAALREQLLHRVGEQQLTVDLGSALYSPELSDAEIVERVASAGLRRGERRGMLRASAEDAEQPLSQAEVTRVLDELVAGLGAVRRVLLIPPDATRAHSGAAELTCAIYARLSAEAHVKLLPALGTHEAMSDPQLRSKESIDRSHFLGAVCGMETIMGRPHTPVRDVLNYMSAQLARELPLTYVCTVRKKDARGQIQTHGLYCGDDEGCFLAGAPLVQRLNLDLLDAPLEKVVVYLDPREFRTTWLGNKAIYRTRMAIADGGELIILGPGVRRFGEDPGIDRLIRRHGYRGSLHTLAELRRDPELAESLSAAAHLIHGSSEGRFRVRWAAGGLTPSEVESVGYEWADPSSLLQRYAPAMLNDGFNRLPTGEEIFFVSNSAWASGR